MLRSVIAFIVRNSAPHPMRRLRNRARFVSQDPFKWMVASMMLMSVRKVRSFAAPAPMIDLSKSKPGDRFVIEHLDISHNEQIKAFKRAKKADKRSARDAKRLARKS